MSRRCGAFLGGCALLSWCGTVALARSRQVHLTLGRNATEMIVTWASWETNTSLAGSSAVWIRPKAATPQAPWTIVPSSRVNQYDIAAEDSREQRHPYSSPFIHHAWLNRLEPGGVAYEYSIDNHTDIFTFTTVPEEGNSSVYPMTVAILGDHGQTPYSNDTMLQIKAHEPTPQFTLLLGDLSYADGEGARWDSWETLVEPLFANNPLMTLPGNHESEYEPSTGESFRGYRTRYPAGPEVAPERFTPGLIDGYSYNEIYDFGASYYAFSVGPLRVITVNSYTDARPGSLQKAWLERELYCVNRSETPWVIIGMHAPWYSTNQKHRYDHEETTLRSRQNLEGIIAASGVVSMVFAGHIHAYERTLPVCMDQVLGPDQFGPAYVVVGDAGNREELYDKWPYRENVAWSAFRNGTRYGFGTFELINTTHAWWRWLPNDFDGDAKDHVLITQPDIGHGPVEFCHTTLKPLPTFDCSADIVKTVTDRAQEDAAENDSKSSKKNFVFTLLGIAAVAVGISAAMASYQCFRARKYRARHDAFFRNHNANFSIIDVEMDEFDEDNDDEEATQKINNPVLV